MFNSYKIIQEIEDIYRKTGLIEIIKRHRTKQIFKLIILPLIICAFMFIILLTFTIINKNPIIQLISLYCFVASILWLPHSNKKYLKIKYGITDKSDEIFYYELFKKNLIEKEYEKNTLIKIKEILEIETVEEKNYFSLYFIAYFSLILLPTVFIAFEKYIKTYIEIPVYVFIFAFAFPILMSLVKMFLDRKQNTKIAILKKIKRIIVELY